MLGFQIALIILVSAPVVGFAVFLWYQIEEYVRHRNLRVRQNDPKTVRRKRK
ncbi:MAG: hypothetical protein IJJ31_03990 [Mogibacterium sp.]|jgi:hypothetical protein|nr:hypothetical protein [Mogibacterium sp.]